MYRITFAEINLDALCHNYSQLKKMSGSEKLMAVVKADSYGHGMIECVRALESINADYYGVALLEEAVELRESGVTEKPILCFAPFNPSFATIYKSLLIDATISSPEELKKIVDLPTVDQPGLHIKIDTGMGRLGLRWNLAAELIKALSSNLKINGIYTHFAGSDEKDRSFAYEQLSRFEAVINDLRNFDIDPGLIHCANSGAILNVKGAGFQMSRAGISLYGYLPSNQLEVKAQLKPVMSLKSQISNTKQAFSGDTISYGMKYKVGGDCFISTIPIGYADGLPRMLSGSFNVMIDGNFYPQIGRVTMDRIMINTGEEYFAPGTEVILLGMSLDKKIDAWDWSEIIGTIPYEITCGISKRVPRKYIK